MTVRLPPVADPDDDQRHLMTTTLQRDEPLNIFRTLAHHPTLLRKLKSLGNVFLHRDNRLDPRLREIVILRSAHHSGSEYEFGQHTIIGARVGLTTTQIHALATPDAAGLTGADALIVCLVDELVATDTVSDGTWAELAAAFDEATLVELLLLPGFYRMLAGFLNTAGVEREQDTPGWPAERTPEDCR